MKFQGRSPKVKDFSRTNSFSRTFQGKPKIQGLFKDCGWICPWKVLEFRGPSLKFQLVVLDFLFSVFWTESLNGYSKLRGTRANFSTKNLSRIMLTSLTFFQFLLLIYNSRTIVIISFLSQEYYKYLCILCVSMYHHVSKWAVSTLIVT